MRFGGCVSATCCYCCCSVDPPLRCPRSRFQSRITGDDNNQTTYYPGMGTSQEESGRVILESELVLKESSTAGADEDRMSW